MVMNERIDVEYQEKPGESPVCTLKKIGKILQNANHFMPEPVCDCIFVSHYFPASFCSEQCIVAIPAAHGTGRIHKNCGNPVLQHLL